MSDETTQLEVRAINDDIVIRDRPSFNGLNGGWVYEGNTIVVDLSTRTTAEDHIWVKHVRGWSPERTADEKQVFLLDATMDAFYQPGESHAETSETETTETTEATEAETEAKVEVTKTEETTTPETTTTTEETPVEKAAVEKEETTDAAKVGVTIGVPGSSVASNYKLQAQTYVRVRSQPTTSGQEVGSSMSPGTVVEIEGGSETQADNYIWVKHAAGWSAMRSVDGTDIFLAEPGEADAGTPTEGKDLPGYRTLIERLPVSMAQTTWFQYFGNNVFAYTDGSRFNYDGYSQGLHGGLDFANKAAGIPIYAGTHCTYSEIKRRSPNLQIWTKTGDYTFIYQHITNPRTFNVGDKLTPDTVIAEVEPRPWFHLHFEIRYKSNLIVNPLLLMPDDMVNEIVTKFNPSTPGKWPSDLQFFYKTSSWTKWTTPLDQPLIQRGGPMVGPKA